MADSFHWADITADKIIREKGDKALYVCASGITPSGTVHIGNFREIISVALTVQALREKGKKVRFLYSWDDYDVFRKVPKNMPQQELLESYLRQPITLVPDVYGEYESYAQYNEKTLEKLLPIVGVEPEFIYQAAKYRNGDYAEGIKTALDRKDELKAILDEHRTTPLPEDWLPVSVFCEKCNRDTTQVTGYDGEWSIHYTCSSCGADETIDLRKTKAAKLPWRIDWPMRWAYEKVDFEPAGKDHHSEGGSFDTAKKTVAVFGWQPPVTFQYDFISIKGRGGKISSSGGDVIGLDDVLEVYTPEITRYLFAGTRPNTEFAISFDLDVLKIYEDYESCERLFFTENPTPKEAAKKAKSDRIYRLSQVGDVPTECPYQIPMRHLCNLLQIHDGNIDAVLATLPDLKPSQKPRLEQKCRCAWNWITRFAPEEFRFSLRTADEEKPQADEACARVMADVRRLVAEKMESNDEKTFGELIYASMQENNVSSADFFTLMYRTLIGKEKGPRLINFMYTIGKEKLLKLL